jgi:MoaA/NifB/PqqE/SkfB family radical SAM enzyme
LSLEEKIAQIDFEYHSDITKQGFQRTLGFMPTLKCNIQCDHCITESGPFRKEVMPKKDLLKWIEDASHIKTIKRICLTGGEAFLLYDHVCEAVSLASSLGLRAGVVSNGFWGITEEKATNFLNPIKSSLAYLDISVDRYHGPYIPVEYAKNALAAAKKLGIKIKLRIAYLYDREEECIALENSFKGILEHTEIDAQPIVPLGRAATMIPREHLFTYDPTGLQCLTVGLPVIYPDGSMYACCGPSKHVRANQDDNPLVIGNLYKNSLLELIEASNENFLFHFIRTKGPSAMFDIIDNHQKEKVSCDHICDACIKMFSDPKLRLELKEALKKPEIIKEIALQRLLMFGEPDLIKFINNTKKAV